MIFSENRYPLFGIMLQLAGGWSAAARFPGLVEGVPDCACRDFSSQASADRSLAEPSLSCANSSSTAFHRPTNFPLLRQNPARNNGLMSRSTAAARLPLDEPVLRPSFRRERAAIKRGLLPVAGCDEAGRGPLAGPVVAAAVILDPNRIPKGLDDSKKLTREEREALFEKICA